MDQEHTGILKRYPYSMNQLIIYCTSKELSLWYESKYTILIDHLWIGRCILLLIRSLAFLVL